MPPDAFLLTTKVAMMLGIIFGVARGQKPRAEPITRLKPAKYWANLEISCTNDVVLTAIIEITYNVIEPASAGLLAQPGVFSPGRDGREI
jgi:hypothetical protein